MDTFYVIYYLDIFYYIFHLLYTFFSNIRINGEYILLYDYISFITIILMVILIITFLLSICTFIYSSIISRLNLF
jgi:hypothetical protein